jgi:uncharacterized protein
LGTGKVPDTTALFPLFAVFGQFYCTIASFNKYIPLQTHWSSDFVGQSQVTDLAELRFLQHPPDFTKNTQITPIVKRKFPFIGELIIKFVSEERINMQTVLWGKIAGEGMEYCEVDSSPVTALRGEVITRLYDRPISISYSIQCQADGSTESAQIICRDNGEIQDMHIRRTNQDEWFCNEQELSEFRGCKDIDLGITPSTNTLPIRRLDMAVGESKEITALSLRFPDLTYAPLTQRYTRVDSRTFLYESIESGYQATMKVDSGAIVITYQSEWRRLR